MHVRVSVHISLGVCMCGLWAVFTAIIISAVCVYFAVDAPQITSLFNIRKCICKSVLHFHRRKNRNDQLLERTINKLHCYRFIRRHCGTIASQIISGFTAAAENEVDIEEIVRDDAFSYSLKAVFHSPFVWHQ